VQYLPALLSTNSWLTLTDGFPAALDTNLTVFIQSNAVPPTVWTTNYSSGGGTNIGGPIPPGTTNNNNPVVLGSTTTGFYRVVRDGVHIFGLTNGEVLSGSIQQPIEFAVDTTNDIVGVTFYDTNDNPLIGASAVPGPGGGWILNWNTGLGPNGNYAVEAELDMDGTNDPVVSFPVTVTVSNLISFPNYLTQLYGSQMWIYAQTVPNADVEIDMYDENTNYLGSFYPISDGNGLISFIWNLEDANGNPLSDTNFMGVWTVYPSESVISQSANTKTVNSASANFVPPSTKETLVKRINAAGGSPAGSTTTGPVTLWTEEPKWTPNNYWIVGVGDIGTQVALQAVYGGTISPATYGGVIGTLEDLHVNMAPGNRSTQWDNEYIVSDPTSRAGLLAYLASLNPRYENFFWFGHGNENSISAEEGGTTITADDISLALGNVPLSSSDVHAALHPYRFVWCESCDTAKGNFCESFAIPALNLSTNNFIYSGLMSRAYLGYKNEIGFNYSYDQGSRTSWDQQSLMWSIFLTNFLQPRGYSLAALVYFAQNNNPPFQNATLYQMDTTATSYGATDMIYPNPY
ncbi:MAG TPA: hypothetical protein VMF08_19845, partial [Candidatus Sulfotelmatobacter sp.]|nr:hypothetical protein [Candidatus Sulfotelmatobacter sp.]